MSDIAILREMINSTATVSVEEDNNKKRVELTEPPPANYSITIHGMPDKDEAIIIKADAFSSPNAVLRAIMVNANVRTLSS
jgi:hypothetical protein